MARYNGPANDHDEAWGMALDASGNVYVTGYSRGTNPDCATVKYDSSGNELWVARYNGPGDGYDDGTAMAVDASGNVYVTGVSFGDGTYSDYATIKYDSFGSQLWVARYDSPAHFHDNPWAIAVDASGNVYVTGLSYVGDGWLGYDDCDYATVKYDSSGNELWVATYDGGGQEHDSGRAIALDVFGNVYVTGSSEGIGTGRDYATVKYDSSGNELWVARYNGPANNTDAVEAVAVDASGNVYVAGRSAGIDTGMDYATVKYDPSGNQLWAARYNGPANGEECMYINGMALDGSGNVYVTGGSVGDGTDQDYATVKYDPSGNELWVARYNGPANGRDYGYTMVLDASGNVYVSGGSYGIGTGEDYATIKYDSSGNELWVARYNGPGNSLDLGEVMALDGSGNLYVTGGSFGDGTYLDYATIKYVQDPAAGIEALIAAVISLNLQQGIENSLDSKLDAAQQALQDINKNNNVAAINALGAFINAVQAQAGVHIPVDDANALIAAAQQIIDVLNS
ncbi:MAG: SBBP repeat-containing protein [Phycisphaerales bacterium]|nr:MAG: SBBP repeat-containing protein [Phycisphaerales bacterium]